MIAILLLLLCCSTAYAHEGTLDPLVEHNARDIRTLQEQVDGKASTQFVISNSRKVDKVQDSQAYTVAYIKIAIGVLGFAVASLIGLLVYTLRRLFRLQES